jgi:hypothetical protein
VPRRLLRERSEEDGDDPMQLTARFKNSLDRLLNIRACDAFNAWDAADDWLDRLEVELLPVAPQAVLALLEQLIAADEVLLSDNNCDLESATFLENVCSFWLYVAARCGGDQKKWIDRICDLFYVDDYCARDVLLSQAHILLEKPALRALSERLRRDLAHDERQREYALKLLGG